MKPICVACQRFYRPKRNGFRFVEGMPTYNAAEPGRAEPDMWRPYKLWIGDLWECPDCLNQIVSGVGMAPLAEHYQDGFAAAVVANGATLQVNDC